MTSLAATIGTGNIAGVATAIFLGGPGAVFWMWMTALVGMATKYAEAVCAVRYREEDERGKHVGGPMYYIKNGLGDKWKWLAVCFALFAGIAGFGIGNMVQANSIAHALDVNFGLPAWITGVILVGLVGAVLIGGIERISTVAGKLVPVMAVAYILVSIIVLIIYAEAIPAAFGLIFEHAFHAGRCNGRICRCGRLGGHQVRGRTRRVLKRGRPRFGSDRPRCGKDKRPRQPGPRCHARNLYRYDHRVFLHRAGDHSHRGMDKRGKRRRADIHAFSLALPGIGGYVIAVALSIFAFTTILGWSYYCERSLQYLFGVGIIKPFRVSGPWRHCSARH